MGIKISRVTPPGEKPVKYYRVADVARAIGCTIDSLTNYINRKLERKASTGMSLEEIAKYLEGQRRDDPRSQFDVNTVVLIRKGLFEKFGILIEEESLPDFRADD